MQGLSSFLYSFSSSKRHSERRIHTQYLTDSEASVLKQVFFKTSQNSHEKIFAGVTF